MKTIFNLVVTLLMVSFISAPLAAQHNFDTSTTTVVLFGALTAIGFASYGVGLPGITSADLAKQIWIRQLMEKFYAESGHLMRSQDMTQFVDYNTINLGDAGADPEVLIDNSTYPIPVEEREDSPLEIPLSRFRTKNTVIRDAESVELSYDKMESVIRGHRNSLIETTAAKATHAWAPAADGSYTPVIQTTGSASDFETSRKAITIADIANAKRKLDLLKVPQNGRILVLHPTHQGDLLKADSALQKAFANLKTGEIYTLFGFAIYVSTLTAVYNKNTGAKVAYGAAAAPSTDSVSSLFYHEAEVMRADGDVKMFARLNDPEADGDIIGFSKRFIGLPIRNKYQGSIISAAS
jgi:hypothetical protein